MSSAANNSSILKMEGKWPEEVKQVHTSYKGRIQIYPKELFPIMFVNMLQNKNYKIFPSGAIWEGRI